MHNKHCLANKCFRLINTNEAHVEHFNKIIEGWIMRMSKPKIKSIDFEVCDKVYKMTLEEMVELQRFLNATFLSADPVTTGDCYSNESSTCSVIMEEHLPEVSKLEDSLGVSQIDLERKRIDLQKKRIEKGDFDGLGFSYGDA